MSAPTALATTLCLKSLGAYGACILTPGHDGLCADAHGQRFSGRRETTMAEYLSRTADPAPVSLSIFTTTQAGSKRATCVSGRTTYSSLADAISTCRTMQHQSAALGWTVDTYMVVDVRTQEVFATVTPDALPTR